MQSSASSSVRPRVSSFKSWSPAILPMAAFDKFYRLAKVSPVEKSAVWFHCKASLRGMVLGLIFAPLVGLIVLLL